MYHRTGVLAVFLAINFTQGQSQLSGTKTIGSGGDYASFTAAVEALAGQGISGAVTFNVLNGTYTEQIQIGAIAGTSPANTITFQSQSGNAAGVTLTFTPTSTDNYVVRLAEADHVTFQNMSFIAGGSTKYGIVFELDGDANDIRILDNVITGVSMLTNSVDLILIYADSDSIDNTIIAGNTLINGSYGVSLSGVGQTGLSSGTQIIDNIFLNQGYEGIDLFYQNAPLVNDNTISGTDVGTGIEATVCDSALQILRNKITIPNQGYGIILYGCTGGAGTRGLTANNFITSLNGSSRGIWLANCVNQNIAHNSVNITGENADGQGLWVDGTTENLNIVSNIFANKGGGYSYSVIGEAVNGIAASDHNDLYTTGTNLAYWDNVDISDLAALRSAGGMETNSLSVDPPFYSTTNLHLYSAALDSAGMPVAGVPSDYDGELRDLNYPDIGADEFSLAVTISYGSESGWTILSLPVIVPDLRKEVLFPTASSNAFAYYPPPVGYSRRDTLENTPGYWLKFPGGPEVTVTGIPILRDTIEVHAGWNLIGTIGAPIPKTAVVQDPPGFVLSQYFGYAPLTGYASADTLKPGKAYWVKTGSAGSIILDVGNTAIVQHLAGRKLTQEMTGQLNQLTIERVAIQSGQSGRSAERSTVATLYFADIVPEAVPIDEFEMPPLPPDGAFDVRFGSNRSLDFFHGNAEDEIPLSIKSPDPELKLSWVIHEQAIGHYSLVEHTGGSVTGTYPLAGNGSLNIDGSGKKRYALRRETIPSQFALYQNYPNPFNPITTISYEIPTSSHVDLSVYNLLGQKVAVLIDERQEAGFKSVVWDASGVSSGVYFYRLADGGFVQTKKFSLVK